MYSIMNGNIKSLNIQGNSWNRSNSGMPASFMATVRMTTGSASRQFIMPPNWDSTTLTDKGLR